MERFFTPISLIDQMCHLLPEHVWTDPSLTWLDPGCGPGSFSIQIYFRLFRSKDGEVIAILSAGIGDFEGFAWGASKRVVKETVERIIQTKDNYVCGTLKVPLTYMTTPAALQLDIDILDGMLVMGSYGNLQGGDVILEFDGLPIGHDKESITMSVFFKKGQTLRAKILRSKQEMTINVKVEELSLLEDVPLGTYNHKIKRHMIE